MSGISPITWALRPLKKYATFSGRAGRAEFWWFFLFIIILYVVMWVALFGVAGDLGSSPAEPSAGMFRSLGVIGIVIGLFWLMLLIPSLAVSTRRLHDTNRSGWWLGCFYLLYAVYVVMTFGFAFPVNGTGEPSSTGMAGLMGAALVGLLFLVYSIALLVFYCLPGTKGPNRFGQDPYAPESLEDVFA